MPAWTSSRNDARKDIRTIEMPEVIQAMEGSDLDAELWVVVVVSEEEGTAQEGLDLAAADPKKSSLDRYRRNS